MLVGTLILLFNGSSAGFVAWRLAGRVEDLADRLLATLLLIPLQIITFGLILGYTGILNATTLMVAHAATGVLAWNYLPAAPACRLPAPGAGERPVFLLFSALLLLYLATALLGQTLVHDALTYRLSRVAHWLQEGKIAQFPTNELRQSYHPVNVDLVMLWLIAPFKTGYTPAQLAQSFGGPLLLLSIVGLARECGLSRQGVLAASIVGFALPNVCVQWSSAQSDLLTAGLLWAGLCLLFRNPHDLPQIALGWSGIAAAIGAKGTVLYLAFGLVALTLCWWLSLPDRKVPWRRHLACAIPAFLLLAAPRHLENQIRFGNPFAPKSAFEMNHGDTEHPDWVRKTGLNLASYVVQALEPASNPPILRTISHPVWQAAAATLPQEDAYDNRIYPRHEYLTEFGPQLRPSADSIATGWLIPVLAALGTLVALGRRRDPVWWRHLGLVLCGLGFLVAFSALFLWWPTSFRYFTLLTPVLAILTASLLDRAPSKFTHAMLAIALFTAGDTWLRVKNAGRAQFEPDPAELLYLSDLENQKAIVTDLIPDGGTVAVLLPWNSPLTGFYRQTNHVRVEIVREQDLLQLPDATYLHEHGWNALVTHPVPISQPAPGMTYLAVSHRVTGEPQYLVHLPR